MSRHVRLIGKAVSLARTVDYKWQHGALLVRGNKILSASTNKVRNSPEIAPQGATFHAEELAYRSLCRLMEWDYHYPYDNLVNITLYIARVDAHGNPTISRPCPSCYELLWKRGLREMYYTNELGGLSHETIML